MRDQTTANDGRRARGAQHVPPWTAALMFAALLCAPFAPSADSFRTASDAVFVRASEAVQGLDEDIFLVRGDLLVRAQDWEISADEATIRGPLGAPDRITVDGAPARIIVTRDPGEPPLEGRSRHFDFSPPDSTVQFDGGAVVVNGTQSVSSESISYQLDRDVFSAGQAGRVKVITTLPQDD